MSMTPTTAEDRASPYGRTFNVLDSFDHRGAATITIKAYVTESHCLVRLSTENGKKNWLAEVHQFVGDNAQVMLKIEGLRATDIPIGSLVEIAESRHIF